jgi:hypothetical protein
MDVVRLLEQWDRQKSEKVKCPLASFLSFYSLLVSIIDIENHYLPLSTFINSIPYISHHLVDKFQTTEINLTYGVFFPDPRTPRCGTFFEHEGKRVGTQVCSRERGLSSRQETSGSGSKREQH